MSSAVDKLLASVSNGMANHAYLVVSSSGDMPHILSQCAKILLCSSHGCNNCDTCAKVDKGVHADSILLPRDRAKNKVLVDDISYMISESILRPIDNSSCRVFSIDATNSIGKANDTVWQNKLLKTLEEPTPDTYILIGVRSNVGVLPTVQSRCQLLLDEGTGHSNTYNHLIASGFRQDIARLAATLSEGNIDSALTIVADPSYYSVYQLVVDMLCHMNSTSDSLVYVSKILSQDSYKNKLLLVLTAVIRDALVCRVDANMARLGIQPQQLAGICANYSATACVGIIELINKTNIQLSNNGNYTLIVDRLIAGMLEEKYRCRI